MAGRSLKLLIGREPCGDLDNLHRADDGTRLFLFETSSLPGNLRLSSASAASRLVTPPFVDAVASCTRYHLPLVASFPFYSLIHWPWSRYAFKGTLDLNSRPMKLGCKAASGRLEPIVASYYRGPSAWDLHAGTLVLASCEACISSSTRR